MLALKVCFAFVERREQAVNFQQCCRDGWPFSWTAIFGLPHGINASSEEDQFRFEQSWPLSTGVKHFYASFKKTLVFNQLGDFLAMSTIGKKYQSVFCANYRTRTALVEIWNNFRCHLDGHKLTALILLDLRAAFVMEDYTYFEIDSNIWLSTNVFFLSDLTERNLMKLRYNASWKSMN